MISFKYQGQSIKLSKFIEKNCPQISYAAFMALLRKKDIKLNGKRTRLDTLINDGDLVEIYFDESRVKVPDLRVVFEDENLLVIDKPQGLLSVSTDGVSAHSILLRTYPQLLPLHRLDKNTKGLLLFAKNQPALDCLKQASKNQQIKKIYSALVYGCVKGEQNTLNGYLKKDAKNSLVKVSSSPFEGAQKIVTEYRVVERHESSTLLEVCIVSGKTHQIRAHLASIGHFILGDTKYGDRTLSEGLMVKDGRQRLCAKQLVFGSMIEPLSYLSGTVIKE